MSRVGAIPTTRVGDYFARQRLLGQIQLDQLTLFELQSQISTGRRLQLPSQDSPAALRAINLQRLIERKDQIRTNLQASNHYLAEAERSISSVSDVLIKIRAEALGVTDTITSNEARQAIVQDIDEALRTLVAAGNTKSISRYLFSGSRPQDAPYEYDGKFVQYNGNEGTLRSYVDIERLFDTNVTGPNAFGGISAPVQGTIDLNPHLTADTLLSTINGGNGISKNAAVTVSINTGLTTLTSVVDLSGAVTMGDVARLIENGAPAGTSITAEVTGTGLKLTTSTGTIQISEVAEGRTARELGFPPGTPVGATITGSDLNPKLLKTTRLGDLLGTKAQGRIVSGGLNNDIVLTAAANGTDWNNATVEFVAGGVAGSEAVTYDSFTNTLTVQVQAGVSTASQVAAAITAEGTFNATVDRRDAASVDQAGSGAVEVANFGVITSGGGGEVLDTTSGLILTNGGESVTLDVSAAETVDDLLNRIMGSDLGFLAEINAAGDGLNIRSRLSGADFTIGENGGTTATQLGIRTYNATTELADLNRGVGVPTADDPAGDDLLITARDGTQLPVNLATAETAQDAIDLINAAAGAAGASVTAQLATTGNGIEIVDASISITGSLTIATVEGSQAAEYLGFVPAGQTQSSTNTPDASGNYVLQSEDRHSLETDSIFNTLLRLRTALEEGNVEEIGRSIERLDVDMDRLNFAAAEIGIRLQNLEIVDYNLQDENVQLQSTLSKEIDVDLVEAISNLTARQYAFEASLRTAASLLNISLLNFI